MVNFRPLPLVSLGAWLGVVGVWFGGVAATLVVFVFTGFVFLELEWHVVVEFGLVSVPKSGDSVLS